MTESLMIDGKVVKEIVIRSDREINPRECWLMYELGYVADIQHNPEHPSERILVFYKT